MTKTTSEQPPARGPQSSDEGKGTNLSGRLPDTANKADTNTHLHNQELHENSAKDAQRRAMSDGAHDTETQGAGLSAMGQGPETHEGETPLPPPVDVCLPVNNFATKNKPSGNLKKQSSRPTSSAVSQSTKAHSASAHDYGDDATPIPDAQPKIYGQDLPTPPVERLDEGSKEIIHKAFRGWYSNLKMTEDVKLRTLEAYAKTGRIGFAAQAGGISCQTIRNHLKEDDNYNEAWTFAYDMYKDRLEAEAYERGVVGWVEPVYGKTGQIGTILKKSERIFELMLKRAIPEFRDKQSIDMTVSGGVLAVGPRMSKEAWLEKAQNATMPESTMKDATDAIDVDFVEEPIKPHEDPPL